MKTPQEKGINHITIALFLTYIIITPLIINCLFTGFTSQHINPFETEPQSYESLQPSFWWTVSSQ